MPLKQRLLKSFAEINNEIKLSSNGVIQELGDILELMPVLIDVLGLLPELQDFLDLQKQYRFAQLDNLVRSSDWTEGCLQISEIYEQQLFIHKYRSFEEYCKSLHFNVPEGHRRVKIAELIHSFKNTKYPYQKTKGRLMN